MTYLLIRGDARRIPLADGSTHCVVTSPPYFGLRDYKEPGQIGLEPTPDAYVAAMVGVFREVRRVLRDDGVCWLNLGDSYATGGGSVGRAPGGGDQGERFIRAGMIGTQPNRMPLPGLKPKDLIGIPWRVAFALQADGWYLRSDVIWHKPNPMPESVTDRPTRAHEYVFLLAKRERYYYDGDAIREPDKGLDHARSVLSGQPSLEPTNGLMGAHRGLRTVDGRNAKGANKRSVWTLSTRPFAGAHFATMPPELAETCILAGCPRGGVVFDPFGGAMTSVVVAEALGRIGIAAELNPEYITIGRRRLDRPHARLQRPDRGEILPLFA